MKPPLEALRSAALARPDDLPSHLVYADALMDAGDPLGEWVSRQCHDPSVEVPHAIARTLLGRLYSQATSWRVVRGVLREVRLRRCTPRDFRRIVGLPEWQGVRSISFDRGVTPRTRRLPAVEVVDLVNHPVCQGLVEVRDLDDESLRRLVDLPRAFERIGLLQEDRRETPISPVQLEARVLELRAPFQRLWPWLLGAGRALFDTVQALELPGEGVEPLGLLREVGPRLSRLTTPEFEAVRTGDRWVARVEPHRYTAHTVNWAVPHLVAAIDQAAPRLARLEVHLPDYGPEVLKRVRSAARGLDFSLVLTGPAEPLRSSQYLEWEADAPF